MGRASRRRLVAAVIAAILVAACGAPPAALRNTAVGTRIDSFLRAVREGGDDFGWLQLRSDVQASYPGGRDAWLAAFAQSDGRPNGWEVGLIEGDGYDGCASVRVAGGYQGLPLPLRDLNLPSAARVAHVGDDDSITICATIGPATSDAGIHGPDPSRWRTPTPP